MEDKWYLRKWGEFHTANQMLDKIWNIILKHIFVL